jgi:serine/threonine protein kinase
VDDADGQHDIDSPSPETSHHDISTDKGASSWTPNRLSSGEAMTGGVGTTFYRAPEQERGESAYNVKADIFSLGVIIFEMFHPPFETVRSRIPNVEILNFETVACLTLRLPIMFDFVVTLDYLVYGTR